MNDEQVFSGEGNKVADAQGNITLRGFKLENPDDVNECIKLLEENGTLRDKKIILKFIWANEYRAFFMVLDYVNHGPLYHPINGGQWEVSCSNKYLGKKGDIELHDSFIYIAEYGPYINPASYSRIIAPRPKTFVILSRCRELYESFTQEVYETVVAKYFHDEENLEEFRKCIKRCLDDIYSRSAVDYETNLNRSRQRLDEITEQVANYGKQEAELTTQIASHNIQGAELTEQIAKYEKQNAELAEQIANREKHDAALAVQIAKHEKLDVALAKKITKQEKQEVKLAEQIANHEKQEAELTEKIASHKKQVADIYTMFSGSDNDGAKMKNSGHNIKLPDKTLFERTQSALYVVDGAKLIYSDDVVRRFVTALFTNQLILLSGPSGTGKSSLVRQIAKVFYPAKLHNIEVQPNWSDAMDLLGFYNPVKNEYVPTPFLEALVDASVDKETLHIVCLDEMNLAHIEYYFASILSAREQDNRINLYAKKYRALAMKKLEATFGKEAVFITSEDILTKSPAEQPELFAMMDLFALYKPEFEIPQNVRFVGTLNMDETVKNISPKVIDRSFVIELLKCENEKPDAKKYVGQIGIRMEEINQFSTVAKLSETQQGDLDKLMKLSDSLREVPNARLNNRGEEHLKQYMNCMSNLVGSYNSDEAIDDLLCSKLLPRIYFDPNDEDAMKAYNKFLKEIKKYNRASIKAGNMGKSKRLIEFWR